MSLVCHRIVSNYTPEGEDTIVDESAQNDVWESVHAFGNIRRLHSKPAPAFIPATSKYDEFGIPKTEDESKVSRVSQTRQDVASWYRNMTAKRDTDVEMGTEISGATTTSTTTSTQDTSQIKTFQHHISSRIDWFSSAPSSRAVNSRPHTLADLLSRNPPPLPSEPAFTPPVFLTLGPSNKGFTMLQKKGWREGEGLGRVPRVGLGMKVDQKLKLEVIDLTQCDDAEIQRTIVDLTELVSEVEDEEEGLLMDQEREEAAYIRAQDEYESPTHGGTALITPLGTVLKADRLGIGLKARRTKKKAITHSPAEIAAFIQTKKRLEKQRWGQGSKGLARKSREEEKRRVQMLKYLNE